MIRFIVAALAVGVSGFRVMNRGDQESEPSKHTEVDEFLHPNEEGSRVLIDEAFTPLDIEVNASDLGAPVVNGEGGGFPSLGDWVSLGEFAWTFMKDNRPNNSMSNVWASVQEEGFGWQDYTPCVDLTSQWFRLITLRDSLFKDVEYIKVDARVHRCAQQRLKEDRGTNGYRAAYFQDAWIEISSHVAFAHELKGTARKLQPKNHASNWARPCAAIDIVQSFSYGNIIDRFSRDFTYKFNCEGGVRII